MMQHSGGVGFAFSNKFNSDLVVNEPAFQLFTELIASFFFFLA